MRGLTLPPITVTDGSRFEDTVDRTVYTFAATWAAFAAGRVVVVTVFGEDTTTPSQSVDSVTIDGIGATLIDRAVTTSGGSTTVGIFAAFVPSGSGASGDVVVTFSAAMNNAAIQITTLFNVQSVTPTFNGNAFSNSAASVNKASVTVQNGGVVLGGGTHNSGNGSVACTWTNLTERSDASFSSERVSHAYDLEAAFTSGNTVTFAMDSGTDRIAMAVGSLR